MITFRSSLLSLMAMILLSACGESQRADDSRVPQLEAKVAELEKKVQDNSDKDERVFQVLKSEMIARRSESARPERGAAMKEFLDGMEKSKTERRLEELESKEFLRSQGAQP